MSTEKQNNPTKKSKAVDDDFLEKKLLQMENGNAK